jgi:hypothetical protein
MIAQALLVAFSLHAEPDPAQRAAEAAERAAAAAERAAVAAAAAAEAAARAAEQSMKGLAVVETRLAVPDKPPAPTAAAPKAPAGWTATVGLASRPRSASARASA